MRKLTKAELVVMRHYWEKGPMFIRELQCLYEDPKPHFNTLSTVSRTLEKDGFLWHKAYGAAHQYYPLISQEEYRKTSLSGMVANLFHNSYLSVVSTLIQDQKISVDELKDLINQIESGKSEEKE